MVKRRQNRPVEAPDLSRFAENGKAIMTDPTEDPSTMTMNDDNDAGANGGGKQGGGMSRAAKKRAKKRAKITTNNTSSTTTAVVVAVAEEEESQAAAVTKEAKKQLPLDDDDEGEGGNDDDDGQQQDDLFSAMQNFRKASSTKKKKKDKKKTKSGIKKEKPTVTDADADNAGGEIKKSPPKVAEVAAAASSSSTASTATLAKSSIAAVSTKASKPKEEAKAMKMEAEDDNDDDDVASTNEMEPELEALLSTLTPLQILLLENNRDEEEDGEEDVVVANDEVDDDNDDENEAARTATANGMPAAAEMMMQQRNNDDNGVGGAGALAGIDPRHLIGDLTTEHRARILVSSLLSPSGVTLHQFYERYWGKRPLLSTLEENDEEEEVKGNNDNGKKQSGSSSSVQTKLDPEDEAIALKHATRFDGFLHRPLIDEMIRRNKLRYGLDLNVTRFADSMGNGLRRRITLDPPPKKRKTKTKGSGAETDDYDLEYAVADPKDVWSNVDGSRGCSLRLLRPHEHNDDVHRMLSLLETEFGCMVGSNAYLTPLNSQGFAPHYDDVDVFVLQLEGYKRWRVYAPFNKRETLPRTSSGDYTEKEVEENGEGSIMDVVLGPGDVLYLPRGWIHQAETVARPKEMPALPGIKDDHSLHLTVSAMQNWCWADFLEMLMPEALEAAAQSGKSISLREGLPRNFLSYMGTLHQVDDEDGGGGEKGGLMLKQAAEAQEKRAKAAGGGSANNSGGGEQGDNEEITYEDDEAAMLEAQAKQRAMANQKQFKDEAKKRIMRVCKQAMSMLDDACDQIGKRFLSDRLPPALLEPERSLTKEGLSSNDPAAAHFHDAAKKIWPNTLVRLARANIARLVMEEDKAVLYHCLDNSRVYHGTPLSPMEFEVDDAPALEQLLTTVEPHWIMVKDLIHGDVEDKMEIAQALFDEGILATMLVESPDRSVQTG